jgi:endogenous inhibitor of DNA gyrase (YacG/DUF329 family)
MPRWILHCPDCQKEFTHAKIERKSLQNHYLEPKPEFPVGGSSVECPHCKKTSVYQRFQLTYRAD